MAVDKGLYEQTHHLIQSSRAGDFGQITDERAINTQILMNSLKEGVIVDPEQFFDTGIDLEHRDLRTGGALLHFAAAYGIRSIIRILLKDKETNYLVRDYKKRYPSELAYEVARDFALGRLLMKKEIRQAGNRIIYGPDAYKIVIRRN